MSSNLPLRTIRIPALRQQCLFQQRRHAQAPRAFSTTARQAFASSSPRLRGRSSLKQDKSMTITAAKSRMGSAPKVTEMKGQQEGAMAEDIGLLQDTLVRAGWGKLPMTLSRPFWSYMWKLLKAKGTGMYSRSMYKRCIYKKGMSSYLPIDAFNNRQLKDKAIKLYTQLYINFAKGDMSSVSRFCLPPVLQSFKDRIASRGPVVLDWQLTKSPSVSVVSHRASLFGEDQPDTAYRQAVFRIESVQKLTVKQAASAAGRTSNVAKPSNLNGVKWLPADVKNESRKETKSVEVAQKDVEFADNGKTKKVVEYFVLQRRVINGQEEDWKIWGFTQESTPERIEEDEVYWRKTLDSHAAEA